MVCCLECGKVKPTPSEDAARDLFTRYIYGKALGSLSCDLCGADLPSGRDVVALATPRTMGTWENDYLYDILGDESFPPPKHPMLIARAAIAKAEGEL